MGPKEISTQYDTPYPVEKRFDRMSVEFVRCLAYPLRGQRPPGDLAPTALSPWQKGTLKGFLGNPTQNFI
jgi:hypothetical protein